MIAARTKKMPMTATIHTLQMRERLRHDPKPIASLYRDLGHAAPREVRRRLALMAFEMSCATEASDTNDRRARMQAAAGTAWQLGLTLLAEVTWQAADALGTPAEAAVWARACRLAEAALNPAQDLLSGAH